MTRQRSSETLGDEAARWRRAFREAQKVIAEQNRVLLSTALSERFADPSDFDLFIGLDAVTDPVGRIRWALVDTLVDELLATKPHLAKSAFEKGPSALEWFTQRSV